MEDRHLTVDEYAAIVGQSRATVYRRIRAGTIRTKVVTNGLRHKHLIPASEVPRKITRKG